MNRTPASRKGRLAALLAALALAATACATNGGSGGGGGNDGGDNTSGGDTSGAPVKVGVVTSTSGLLSSYGKQFEQGFRIGIDFATDGTGAVDGHKLDITVKDDATDPAKAVSEVTDLVGNGYKIITGSVSSGVSAQVAPLAEQNDILYISGASAADAITGINHNTFRSGRQTYQDVKAAEALVGDIKGKKVVVFAQDYEFGQANVAAVKAVLGDEGGADVVPVLAPVNAADLTPFARQIIDQKPDLVFIAWAGETTNAMWKTLSQQGVFDNATVVTGLGDRTSWDDFGPAATKIDFLSHYFAEASDTDANQFLVKALEKENVPVDLFHNDGFVAAQLVAHAVHESGGDDVAKMIDALEGWTFTGPKGEQTIRTSDHAMLQPMFLAKLDRTADGYEPKLVDTLSPDQVAPPEG